MVEIRATGPRVWLEIPDQIGPQDEPDAVFRVDLTWLSSRWSCIFGRGCPGILVDRPDDGCCSLGAHFSGPEDQARVEALVPDLDAGNWQLREAGLAQGVTQVDEEGEAMTRLVDGACVFLNRPDFPGGAGCALHRMALERGLSITTTKPDVCWQLPLRRSYEEAQTPDGRDYQVTVIGEYDRRGWGPGGQDLDWYCTTATEAHRATQPVYVTLRDELIALLGAPVYEQVADHCTRLTAGLKDAHPGATSHRAQPLPTPTGPPRH